MHFTNPSRGSRILSNCSNRSRFANPSMGSSSLDEPLEGFGVFILCFPWVNATRPTGVARLDVQYSVQYECVLSIVLSRKE